MRHALSRLFRWAVPALLVACGPVQESEAPMLAESAQAVLYPPPAPASGNIVDSTAFLGPLPLGGAVQTQFTTQPRFFSFSFKVRAGAQVKLEVTHLGSSMYLDTGLFVYGPRRADGSWGTYLLAMDDDAGYGELSKIPALALTQGGEYLAVVSSGTGIGKRFRLQLDCINGACADVDPALYTACDLDVAGRIEVCVEGAVEDGHLSLAEAHAFCTGSDDAQAAFTTLCNGTSTAPAWCDGGVQEFSTKMWPVCRAFYWKYYGLGALPLTGLPLSSVLQTAFSQGQTHCKTGENWCDAVFRTFNVPSVAGAPPVSLNTVVEGVFAAMPELTADQDLRLYRQPDLTYAEFADQANTFFPELVQALPSLGNGTEVPQVARLYGDKPVAPGAKDYHNVYIVYFPVSHRTAVLWINRHEI